VTRAHRLVQAWKHDPVIHEHQLTHAAPIGSLQALCGTDVIAWGDDWNPAKTRRRCTVCAQGAHHWHEPSL
jgi:hypothetical protein